MPAHAIGSVVRCRNREWVVLPSSDDDVYQLRPLAGSEEEIIGIHTGLVNLGLDPIESASFPLPNPEQVGDAAGAALLFNAARLALRDGAGPFRSLGRIGVRPRPYQFVPLLMALRLDPIRLLIADDVGIGKTIEALLIARELLDRGEISRSCIICPPYLCDQWQKELWEKFRISAEVIRSGTVNSLERQLPGQDYSIFSYFPHTIVSIDYVKSDQKRDQFLQHAPDFIIVDEAHGAADHMNSSSIAQQRHKLLVKLAEKKDRHMVLLTATPHSGLEAGFFSLLGLLNPEFRAWNLQTLAQAEKREQLARHFVQRRRADVNKWMGEATPFPDRESEEHTFRLSEKYQQLFHEVYEFCREMVRDSESLSGRRQRIRYWAALALLRTVMSSPAAASASIQKRLKGSHVDTGAETLDDSQYSPYIFEESDNDTEDVAPSHIIEQSESGLPESEQVYLQKLGRMAETLHGTDADTKIVECARLVAQVLRSGYRPIVWSRYIATSDYVCAEIKRRLSREFPDLDIRSITGSICEEERRAQIEGIEAANPHRVLCATDCLSEGINLQNLFNAVIHYDLPWNPNRLEQREGRVDRFGQRSPSVKAVLLYGADNPIDGAVLDVLLRKARNIHKTLGVRVPVPIDSQAVMEAVVRKLFTSRSGQLDLFAVDEVKEALASWDWAAKSEEASRTKYAQRAIKPEEVQRELADCDPVLTNPSATRLFVQKAAERLDLKLHSVKGGAFRLGKTSKIPDYVEYNAAGLHQPFSFDMPPPEGAEYMDRNHPFVQSLAQWLLEEAVAGKIDAIAKRCGAIRTKAVEKRTVLLLARLRYTISTPERPDLLAEEVRCFGFRGAPGTKLEWLPDQEGVQLLETANPAANISAVDRTAAVSQILDKWLSIRDAMESLVAKRARHLEEAHKRVRSSIQLKRTGTSVAKHFPPDLLGFTVLLPVSQGVH
jgi:superfamily II DNA or RNA helicase